MEITGRIVQLNELGFELVDDSNHRHSFGVAMDAIFQAGDLHHLEHDGTRVVVVYDPDTPEIPVAYGMFRASPPGDSPSLL